MAMEYLKVHVCSLIYANLWHQWAVWKLQKEGSEDKIPILIRAHRPTATQRANHALWQLGNGQISLEDVLREFGARSENSWALFAPRWCEVPNDVETLGTWMKGTEDPKIKEDKILHRLENEMKNLPVKMRAKMRIVQQYLYLREEQRFSFERLLLLWKESWIWIEKQAGFPIRHLLKTEIESFQKGMLPQAKEIAEQRQKEWSDVVLEWKKIGAPPQFLLGDQILVQGDKSDVCTGIGISQGYAEGRVRIVRTLQDASTLEEGDILFVTTLDPGWTPLLLKAGGMVMELGGMLSHGAVIAREYRVPAVAALEGACTHFVEGAHVALDGQAGTVWNCS